MTSAAFERPQARSNVRALRDPRLGIDESKLYSPYVRPDSVTRTALVNRLRAAGPVPMLTVSASAGYGKTTVLAQWAARDARPFAWLSLDERDNDPLVLLRHVAAALDEVAPLDARVVAALSSPRPARLQSLVPRVGASLHSVNRPVVLVLDDSHLLRSRDSLHTLATLADFVPEGSTLVLSGRTTPRIPVAALRAAGRLLEIDAGDLSFDRREAQLLLHGAGLDVDLAETAALNARCDGWPVGLYLAALALRETENDQARGSKLVTFRGEDRYVTDYFRAEYLSDLRPGTLTFLRRTSILERLSGPLCDAMLDETGSANQLEKLERSNLFLLPLDRSRSWYRYHHLFRDVLLRELHETEPKLVATLHRRAASWLAANGDLEAALEHAFAGGDVARAAALVTTIAIPVCRSGRAATVEAWLDRFDESLLERHPAVALHGSWVYALRGRADKAERWLLAAERAPFKGTLPDGSRTLKPWIALVRAVLCRDGVDRMRVDAESALAELPPDSIVRPSASVLVGIALSLLGQDEQADAALERGTADAEKVDATNALVVGVSERALIAAARGDAAGADALAFKAFELVESASFEGNAASAIAMAASARAHLRRGNFDAARILLAKAQLLKPLLAPSAVPWFGVQTRLELVRAYLALRDRETARSLLAEAHEILRENAQLGVLEQQALALQNELDGLPARGGRAASGLTAAELRLLPLLATHLSFREIGERLYVSRNTIKTQAISVYRKLGVSSRSEAIRRADELGLVQAGAGAA